MSDPHRRALSLVARNHMNSKCADCRSKGQGRIARTRALNSDGHWALLELMSLDVVLSLVPAPTHASYTLGIFLCQACAECHQRLPDQMSLTRSLMYDLWDATSVDVVSKVGNLKSNAKYEAKLNIRDRVLCDAASDVREAFIRAKYVDRQWYGEPSSSSAAISEEKHAAASSSPSPSPSPTSSLDSSSEPPLSRNERRRRLLNQKPKMCELEAMELEMQRTKEIAADKNAFDPVAAQAALQQLYASASGGSSPLPPLNPTLSFLLTTSAVPSNPSLELIEGVLTSCEAHLGFDKRGEEKPCVCLVIMDGYTTDEKFERGQKPRYKNGKLEEQSIAAYEQFKTALRAHIASQPYPHLFLVPLELPFRHGFAGAVHQSLHFITTPLMFVMQHDWCFIRPLQHSVWQLCDLLEHEKPMPTTDIAPAPTPIDPTESHTLPDGSPSASSDSPSPQPLALNPHGRLPIHYITFQASTTVKYLEKDFHVVAKSVGPEIFKLHEYPIAPRADGTTAATQSSASSSAASSPSPAPSVECTAPIPLCPVFFWFDRNHLVRTSFYRENVFGAFRFMRSAAFIEDTFGQIMLNMLRGTLNQNKRFTRKPFTDYSSYIYYTDGGLVPHLDHVHGRKFITALQRVEQYGGDHSLQAKSEERKRAQAAEEERVRLLEQEDAMLASGMYE